MANPEHLAILRQGVEQWNKWRKEYPDANLDLRDADLSKVYLRGADLLAADFSQAILNGADLSEANVSAADFTGADLVGVNLPGADLRLASLKGADLRSAVLNEARLYRTDLSRADLSGANLRNAGLSQADLRRSDLRKADLGWAELWEANLGGADLTFATLTRTDLSRADLTEAEFNEAIVSGTHFADVDLSVAKGLEAVKHEGPSTIGIDTIYKSRGKIPEVFLRGCGVPDEFIAYIGSMVGRPIEFYSCFISYSTKDQEFADRLYADLQAKGVRCWFAPHDIKGGRKLHEQIDEAIRLHDRLLLILSEDSMKSEWVKTEIAKARKREVKDGKRVLFPVRLVGFEALRDWECFDADTGKDSAREIREYFIPDFSNWKEHDSYQAAFQRLVRDLKAEASAGAAS
jgi:uncharacterized protein YjbI with pentapeptide repeats